MNITNDIKYIGVIDRKIDLFEGQYVVPNGMSYNSYVILDEIIDRNPDAIILSFVNPVPVWRSHTRAWRGSPSFLRSSAPK